MTINTKIIIGIVAVVVLGGGALIVLKRQNSPLLSNPTDNMTVSERPVGTEKIPPQEPQPPPQTPTGWKTYTNTKAGYSIDYPPYVNAGSVANNSVLGTFDAPVPGVYVGSLVLVSLTSASLEKTATDYFNSYAETAKNPPPPSPEGPSISCKMVNITNLNATIQAVSCSGEGGPAFYALISGGNKMVFVDGYSRGFSDSGVTEFKNESDLEQTLSTFKFIK